MNSKSALWIILKNLSFHNYLFLLQFLFFYNGVLQAQWVKSNDFNSESVYSLAVNGTNIFADLFFGGVFISTDNGATWAQVNNGLAANGVNSFVVSGNNILTGTNGGVFLSTNNGSNWIKRSNGLKDPNIISLVISGTTIFAGSIYEGLFMSTDYGENWTSSGLIGSITSLAVSGTDIYAGNYNYGVYLSTDNGTNWVQVNNGLTDTNVTALTICGNNIFAGTASIHIGNSSGVFLSTNKGTNWTQVNNGLSDDTWIKSFAISGNNLFASSAYDGVFLSTDYGKNWIPTNNGLIPHTVVNCLAVSGSYILAGTFAKGVWKRSISEEINDIPRDYLLFQNYPNPFNPHTMFRYTLPVESNVKLTIYNALGQKIKEVINTQQGIGQHEMLFIADDLSSGVYFYSMKAISRDGKNEFNAVKKMILIK